MHGYKAYLLIYVKLLHASASLLMEGDSQNFIKLHRSNTIL